MCICQLLGVTKFNYHHSVWDGWAHEPHSQRNVLNTYIATFGGYYQLVWYGTSVTQYEFYQEKLSFYFIEWTDVLWWGHHEDFILSLKTAPCRFCSTSRIQTTQGDHNA